MAFMAKKAVILFSFLVFLYTAFSIWKIVTTTAPDFTVFYQSAEDVVRGINPYEDPRFFTGLGYPVVTSILYLPLLFFSQQVALGLFVVASALAVPLTVFLCLRIGAHKVSLTDFLLFTALAYLSFPIKFTLGMGQSNLVAGFLLIASFYCYKTSRFPIAGVLFGFCLVMKPLLGFMVFFYLFKRAWGILGFATIVVAGFFMVSLIIYGIDIYQYYFTMLVPHLLNPAAREIYYNQGIMGFVARLVPDLSLRKVITSVFTIMLVLPSIVWLWKNRGTDFLQFAILLTVLVLIDTLAWQHHFAFLLFPYILATLCARSKNVYLLFALFLSFLLVSANIKTPLLFQQFPHVLLLSHVFYGAVLLFFILTHVKRYASR